MTDGELLRHFIDNQHKSKIAIARDLKMSKQNLFGLFKSRELEPETRARFEEYFGKRIFTNSQASQNGTSAHIETAAEGQKKDPLLGDLIVSTRKLSDSNLINAENIRRLITLLEFSLGKQNTAPVEHLPGPPIEQADYGPAKVENLKDKKQTPSKGK